MFRAKIAPEKQKNKQKSSGINDSRGFLVRVVGLKPTSLAVPNRAFYQLNYTRIFGFEVL